MTGHRCIEYYLKLIPDICELLVQMQQRLTDRLIGCFAAVCLHLSMQKMAHALCELELAHTLTLVLARRAAYLHDEPMLQRMWNLVTSKEDLLVPV